MLYILTPADITEQTESIRAKGTLGLNCNWGKIVEFGQQCILLHLSGFSTCGYSCSSPCGIMQRCMRLRRCENKKRHWPYFHGAMEQLSGHLPSDMHRPMGSSVDGHLLQLSDLCMMALIAAFP